MALFDVVFEGGGAKGSALVGALNALEAAGHTTHRLIGTSAGAVVATLRAAGYSPTEMLAIINEKVNGVPRFSTFMDHPTASDFTQQQLSNSETMRALQRLRVPLIAGDEVLTLLLRTPGYPNLFSLTECGGVFAGNAVIDWLGQKLRAKGFAANETIAGFFAITGVDLSMVASDTTEMEMLVLNHRTAPNVPVVWAVRMSMSIPFVWREVLWQDSWGLYQGRRKTGNAIVDGGVLSNFPIRLFADPEPAIMGPPDTAGALPLGLMLDENLPVPGQNLSKPPDLLDQNPVLRRISRLMDTMMGAQDNQEVRDHAAAICRLPVKGYGTTEFAMSDAKLNDLVTAANNAMVAHLAARELISTASAGA
jgi:NTE family protein